MGTKTTNAHLEELVDIPAEDGEKSNSFQQATAGILGQGEHASVELEQRELTIDEALRLYRFVIRRAGDRTFGSRRNRRFPDRIGHWCHHPKRR